MPSHTDHEPTHFIGENPPETFEDVLSLVEDFQARLRMKDIGGILQGDRTELGFDMGLETRVGKTTRPYLFSENDGGFSIDLAPTGIAAYSMDYAFRLRFKPILLEYGQQIFEGCVLLVGASSNPVRSFTESKDLALVPASEEGCRAVFDWMRQAQPQPSWRKRLTRR